MASVSRMALITAREAAVEWGESIAADTDVPAAVQRVYDVAKCLVKLYACRAPHANLSEALVRVGAYMRARSGASGAVDRIDVGTMRTHFGDVAILRRSGARELLEPWRVRRASAVRSPGA